MRVCRNSARQHRPLPTRMLTGSPRRPRPLPALLGAALVGASLLLGLLVGRGGTWLDRTLTPTWVCAGGTVGTVCEALATERGWPFPVYATAVAPLLATGLLLRRVRRAGAGPGARAWAWALATLVTVPAQHVLSVSFARVGPLFELKGSPDPEGAYPSGAAVLVAVAWSIAAVVISRLRPAWRSRVAALAAVALAMHMVTRVVALKHWPTDILGSYLLVGGVLLVAAAFAPSDPSPSAGPATMPAQPGGTSAVPDRDVGGDPQPGRQQRRVGTRTEPDQDGVLDDGAGGEEHL
jgi:membrane-associated phospholipid phosphatase